MQANNIVIAKENTYVTDTRSKKNTLLVKITQFHYRKACVIRSLLYVGKTNDTSAQITKRLSFSYKKNKEYIRTDAKVHTPGGKQLMNKVTEGKYVGEWEKRNQLQHTTVHSDSE